MDYQSKIYAAPLRDAGTGIKPHLQEDKPGTSCSLSVSSLPGRLLAAERDVVR